MNKVENKLTNIFNKLLNENVLIKNNIRYFSLKDVSDLFNIKNKRDTLLKLKNTGMDDYIYDKKINLVALTSVKRSLIYKLFNPSLSKKMLYQSNVPVLLFQA